MAHFSQSPQSSNSSGNSLHYQPQVSTAAAEYIERVDHIYSNTKNAWVTVPSTDRNIHPDTDTELAFVVKREFDKERVYLTTILIIQSTHLGEFMSIVLHDVDGIGPIRKFSEVETHILYHYLDSFKAFDINLYSQSPAMSTMDDQEFQLCLNHINALISFLDYEYNIHELLAEQFLSYSPPLITFNLLCCAPRGAPTPVRLYKYASMSITQTYIFFVLDYITYGDKGASYSSLKPYITQFKGVMKVSELRFFPFEYHIERARMETRLEERGRRYIGICEKGKQYVCCSMEPHGSDRNYDSRLVIDPKRYSIEEGGPYRPVGDLDRIHYQLCDCYLWVFIVEDKEWDQVHIDKITDVIWKEEMLDNVVLEPATKTMIKGLINNHDCVDPNIIEDIMPGKGSGLIMLFSGPPGIGKTLTAEAVAEATHRPIYRISTNDLSCEPEELEDNLQKILNRGSEWNLVLLIDEADVFLEQRTGFDVKRNSLVSVFLRQLEYYKGILILTTNRLETIDRSLESRIHFKLRFPEMNKASRIQLWQLFLKDKSQNISYREIQQLSEFRLNGRMIKHAASLGLALSKIQNESLAFTHIRSGLRFIDPSLSIDRESSTRFDDYSCASPLDPGMTPGQTADTPGGSREISGELIHAEPSHRSQSGDIGRDGFGLGRASKRPRFS